MQIGRRESSHSIEGVRKIVARVRDGSRGGTRSERVVASQSPVVIAPTPVIVSPVWGTRAPGPVVAPLVAPIEY